MKNLNTIINSIINNDKFNKPTKEELEYAILSLSYLLYFNFDNLNFYNCKYEIQNKLEKQLEDIIIHEKLKCFL